MNTKKKLKLKKFKLHPITTYLILILITILFSGIFSLFEMQATYNIVGAQSGILEKTLVNIENLLNYDGLRYLISNATINFITFTPLSMLLISLLGVGIAESSGLLDTIIRKKLLKLTGGVLTFLIIFISTISSLINEVGFAIMIPLAALLFLYKGRNPLVGIVAAFSGVAFGYGTTIFVGSMEIALNPLTETAARLIDPSYHVGLASNLIIMIASSIILSIIGTIIVEKVIIKKLGTYKVTNELRKTQEIKILSKQVVSDYEQDKIAREKGEKKGLRNALIVSIIIILAFIYMLIPNLPWSGMLLDLTEKTYVNQLFGENSYFQDGFTFMIALLFMFAGIAYGIGAKTIKNDRDVVKGFSKYMSNIGEVLLLLFVASQFVSIFRKSNIGTIITGWGANLVESLNFSGIPLIILCILVIAISNLFLTSPSAKWTILSPVMIPMLTQSNITPQFSQFLFRAADSMTNGVTPLLASFVLYIGYLNIYNDNKEAPIGINQAIKYISPYFIIISITWLVLIVGWYLLGLPVGPGVFPTL